MNLNFSNEFNTDLNIFYYRDRINAICASIDSMIADYSEYVDKSNISNIFDLQKRISDLREQYIDISESEPVDITLLAEIVTEAFNIEDSLVKLSSSIWYGEIRKNKIALFHTPANQYNLTTKGFRSVTVVFLDPNEDIEITNGVYRVARYGEAYELDPDENIIVGNNLDISSGIFGNYEQESHSDHFKTKDGRDLWSIQAGSRICTPLQAARCISRYNLTSINEVVINFISHEEPNYMIFDGSLEGYVLLKIDMKRRGIDLPIIPIHLNPAREFDPYTDDLYASCGVYSYGADRDARIKEVDELCKEYYEFIQEYSSMERMNMSKIYEARGLDFNASRVFLGGTGEMYRCEKELRMGTQCRLFKPAQSKLGRPEEFRAYIQEAAYHVQQIVDYRNRHLHKYSPISCEVCIAEINGEKVFGAIQDEIPVMYDGSTLKSGKLIELIRTKPSIREQLMREFVIDYLLCNFDSHAGNFIIDENGILRGIDKEQSFRYINDVDDSIDTTYHPNAIYGEQEPIYNTMFRMYKNGEIDLDFDVLFDYIDIVERYNDWQYMELFRTYSEGLYDGEKEKSEELLSRIRERKIHLREACRDLVFELEHTRARFDADSFENSGEKIEQTILRRPCNLRHLL